MIWKFLRYIRLFSLDIVAGACVSALFFGRILGVDVGWLSITCLGIAVWLIYTMDHLLDGLQVGTGGAFRHVFHKRYRWPIFLMWSLVAAIGLLMSFKLHIATLQAGLLLALTVLIYFLLSYMIRARPIFHKEVLAALVFTVGVTIPAITESHQPFDPVAGLFLLQYFLLVLLNLLFFAKRDEEYDTAQRFGSLPSALSHTWFQRLLQVLCVSLLVLALVGFAMLRGNPAFWHQVIFGLMVAALIILDATLRERKFKLAFQLLADSIFLLPVIVLL